MPICRGEIARVITMTITQKVPLRAYGDQGKPRFARYQIQRRGTIARLTKPKRRKQVRS